MMQDLSDWTTRGLDAAVMYDGDSKKARINRCGRNPVLRDEEETFLTFVPRARVSIRRAYQP